jgi:hypothetical protein
MASDPGVLENRPRGSYIKDAGARIARPVF